MSTPITAHPAVPTVSPTADVQSLLALGDEDFVRQAYRLILGRDADDGGLDNYLARVRNGDHKAQLVVQLALSDEGRQRHVKVPGLEALIEAHADRPVPLPRRILRRLLRPLQGPSQEPLAQSLRAIDNRLYRLEQMLVDQGAAMAAVAEQLAQLQRNGVGPGTARRSAASSTGHQSLLPRHTPPRADQIYRGLARMLARRTGS